MSIPFLDLITPHRELEEELVAVFRSALSTATFIGGPTVERFEKAFAAFCGTQYCVGVGSGTDALRFALMAAGVRAGDAVITVPNTFIATAEAISQAGALPEFVDVEERTYNIDVEKLRSYFESDCAPGIDGRPVSRRSGRCVSAIVPVHLYGQPAHMDPILDLAECYGLVVIEDACQAHGAEYFSGKLGAWRKAGSMGSAAAFSFYPGKNLGACGEGGAVTTDDEQMAQQIRMLRDHGQERKYFHAIEGYNGRLDAIQAGILLAKLPHLGGWNEQRREAAARYREMLAGCEGVLLPYEPSFTKPGYHLFVVQVDNREGLMAHLAAAGIGTAIHYPVPLHLQEAYRHLGYRENDFPVAERVAADILSLPMYPQLTPEQQQRVVEQASAFTAAARVA